MKEESLGKTIYDHGQNKYTQEHAMAEKIYHEEWYSGPAKQPPSALYRQNYDQIKWDTNTK